MIRGSIHVVLSSKIVILLAAVGLAAASCGAPDVGVGSASDEDFEEQNRIEMERMERDALNPEDEGKIAGADDDMDPPPTIDPSYTVLDEPITIVDHPLMTFEQAIDATDYVFTAAITAVSDGSMWNTSDGRYGSHADWEDSAVEAFEWQQIDVRVTDVVKGDLKVGDQVQLVYYAAEPSFHAFDASAIGAVLLVGATDWTIEYRDGTTVQAFDIHTQATYVSFSGGPALRLYNANSGSNWRTLGGATAKTPSQTSVDVAISMDELLVRALNPGIPLEQHLGYYDIYGPRETNPDASDVVP